MKVFHIPTCLVLILDMFVVIQLAAGQPFWFDEFFSLTIAKDPFLQVMSNLWQGFDSHPPLHYVLIQVAQFFHINPRAPFLLAYLISLCFIVKISKTPNQSFFALMFVSLSAGAEFGWECRPYSLLLLSSSMLVDATLQNKHSIALFAICLAAYSHLLGMLLLVPWVLIQWQNSRYQLSFTNSFLVLFICLPVLLQGFSAYSHYKKIRVDISQKNWTENINEVERSFIELVTAKGWIMISLAFLWEKRAFRIEKQSVDPGILWIFLLFGALALCSMKFLGASVNARYNATAIIPLALLAGYAVADYSLKKQVCFFLTFAFLLMSSLYHHEFSSIQKNERLVAMSDYIGTHNCTTDVLSLPYLLHYIPNASKCTALYDGGDPFFITLAEFFNDRGYSFKPRQSFSTQSYVYFGRFDGLDNSQLKVCNFQFLSANNILEDRFVENNKDNFVIAHCAQ